MQNEPHYEHLSQEIIEAGRFLYARGWSPATSSNYSTRLSASQALLTLAILKVKAGPRVFQL